MKLMRRPRISAMLFACDDCYATLAIRPVFGTDWDCDWFMVKDRVWRHSQRKGSCRFLCVQCLEGRIGRRLSARDFKRSAQVNFVGRKSARLRHRMRGLRPAKRLIQTTFTP